MPTRLRATVAAGALAAFWVYVVALARAAARGDRKSDAAPERDLRAD